MNCFMKEDAFVLVDATAVGRICAHSLRYDGGFSKSCAKQSKKAGEGRFPLWKRHVYGAC